MFIEPIGLELAELYAPVPNGKKPKSEKYILRNKKQKLLRYIKLKARIKQVPVNMRNRSD